MSSVDRNFKSSDYCRLTLLNRSVKFDILVLGLSDKGANIVIHLHHQKSNMTSSACYYNNIPKQKSYHCKQNQESTKGYSKNIVRKNNKFGKRLVSTSRTYASPKGTGPGVQRIKRLLSACHTRRKCSMENYEFGKGSSLVQSLISRELSLYMVRSQNVI